MWASINVLLTNALPSTAAYAFFSPDGRSAFGNPIGTLAVTSSLSHVCKFFIFIHYKLKVNIPALKLKLVHE